METSKKYVASSFKIFSIVLSYKQIKPAELKTFPFFRAVFFFSRKVLISVTELCLPKKLVRRRKFIQFFLCDLTLATKNYA